ncbi:MAG: aldo/keto reductase [Elusimicrobia bacterium]|nr:aldo/keto reductase [Elusimicrobiota bacterium]
MEYRTLGSSNLEVSCLGLGGNIFGHFCDIKETETIIKTAFDNGINFIDTADVYSDGLSEEFIGAAIRHCRKKCIIATKVGVTSTGTSRGIGRKKYILSNVEGSLKRLNTDYIDLYQMHHFDYDTPLNETLEALHLLIKEGKVLYIGTSNYSGEQLEHSLQLARTLSYDSFSSAQNSYNLLKRDIENDILPICKKENVGLIVYGALARGILSGKYRLNQDIPLNSRAIKSASIKADITKSVLDTVEKLIQFSECRKRNVNSLALAWLLCREEISSVLIGIRNVAQLEGNLNAIDWKLSNTELAEIDNIMCGFKKEK